MSHIRVSWFIVLVTLAVLMLVPMAASARVVVGVGFGPYWGVGYPWGWGWGWGPGWGPYYGYPYAYAPYGYAPYGYGYGVYGRPLGEVQIKTPDSRAQIYVNGSYAGQAHDLKKIYLKPGTYNLEQHIGSDVQKQRVYVLANRTVKVEFGKVGTPSPPLAPPPPDYTAPRQPNSYGAPQRPNYSAPQQPNGAPQQPYGGEAPPSEPNGPPPPAPDVDAPR